MKMSFTGKEKTRKRVSRQVSRVNRRNKKLKEKVIQLQRQVWKLKKKGSREGDMSSTPSTPKTPVVATPVKRAEEDLRQEGISPRKVPNLRRKLIMQHSVVKSLKTQTKAVKKSAIKSASRTHSAWLLSRAIKVDRRDSV